jgi:putative transposase
MTDTSTVPRVPDGGKPARRPLVDDELADQLLGKAQAEGVELLGPDGLLSQVTKAVLERALAEEMTGHLGYEKHDPAGRGSGNSRNGTTPKTLLTDIGAVDLAVPRDRDGSFEPKIVRKGQTRLEGFNERIIALYARGMTTRDIRAHLREIYGVEVSPDLISRVTDAVVDELQEWQARPLDRAWYLAVVANHRVACWRSHRRMSWLGVLSLRQSRGRSLSSAATWESCSAVQICRSVPLGKYWRRRPLVFSLLPRCQGECGSAK